MARSDSQDPGTAGGGDGGQAPAAAELDTRIGKLERGMETILGLLQKKEGQAHDAAAAHERDKLDRPSGVADEIARALDERDAREAAAKRDQDDQAWRKGVDEKLTGLTEQAPEPPVRKVEQRMKWR